MATKDSTEARVVRLGTRGSTLARWQTEWVAAQLQRAWPKLDFATQRFVTQGDRELDRPLPEIGGKGLFTEEIETALRHNGIDLAVHSLKDLPLTEVAGLTLAAIPLRADVRDVLISSAGYTLATLPAGAQVGTSSVRRSAQLLSLRPDLRIVPLRGNVDSRVRQAAAGAYSAIVLAAAGIQRLGLTRHISEFLRVEVMLPAPGQGALAIQCRSDDFRLQRLLEPIEHAETRTAVAAERAFLAALGGGCAAPIAALASVTGDGVTLHGLIATPDGQRAIRVHATGRDPLALGLGLAAEARARGADEILR